MARKNPTSLTIRDSSLTRLYAGPMAKTGAERQAAWRKRQLQAATENNQLRAEVERLTAELAEATSNGKPRCPSCRSDLACPQCYRAGDYE